MLPMPEWRLVAIPTLRRRCVTSGIRFGGASLDQAVLLRVYSERPGKRGFPFIDERCVGLVHLTVQLRLVGLTL